jgi:enamine deaminase RidA (YjgF/YER057c/UK114 family)
VTVDERLAELGIVLPNPVTPIANYSLTRRSGNLLFVSGHVARRDGAVVTGRLGDDLTRDEGYALARAAAIDVLAAARATVGSLDRVRGVVKLTGFVSSAGSFTDQSAVVNGASDLVVDVFGSERGTHARSAVGVAQLPLGAAVELEAVLEIEG